MSHLLLVPGAGGAGFIWHRVVAELADRGHVGLAVDLPAEDPTAGLAAYADVCVRAVAEHGADPPGAGWIVVGQSMGALTAPLLVGRIPVAELVLLNPMVPRPGETGGAWWAATGQAAAAARAAREGGWPAGFDLVTTFLHDLDPATRRALKEHEREETDTVFDEPWPLAAWPDVLTRVVASTGDRLFPPAFVEQVTADRLGLPVTRVPGGHLSPLSRPAEVTDALLGVGA